MKTVILCGGLGTRLREETEYRPKPMVEVGGRPILWHIMKLYGHHGFNDFVLCLGYRGHMIKEYFLNYEAINNDFTVGLGREEHLEFHSAHDEHGFSVTLAETGAESMTGGRIKRVEKYVDGDIFMVTYGDGVANVDIKALVDFHRSHGRLATMTAVHLISRFGVVEIDTSSRVSSFSEKPSLDSWISAGFFVFNRRVFDYLDGDGCILEREPLERLACEGELMAFRHERFFFAMDTLRDYQNLKSLWDAGKAPWKVW